MAIGFVDRDPARVERIAELLEQLWNRYPQLRLGQLLCNVEKQFERVTFFVEDDVMEAAIRKVLDTGFNST